MRLRGSAVPGCGVLLLHCLLLWRPSQADHPVVTISRHHKGDMFTAEGSSCSKDVCVGSSSGTAGMAEGTVCACQCLPHLPVFREDLHICIDDIHECSLAPFVSGTTTQKIPFVFLPLKGQIVYPSAEINFSGTITPICVVSGAQFLTRGGWVDLHNNSYVEPPFRLFRDEGRTFLQWLGEVDLRFSMEGRLMLVHLMCKDVGSAGNGQDQSIFTPCVAFRVAGTPSIREVLFAADAHATDEVSRGLSVSEYIAIGVCSILLGLIYVASVFLYLHVRRRRKENCLREKERDLLDNQPVHLAGTEEGVIKSNPLLAAKRHHLVSASISNEKDDYLSDSGSCCSDTDALSDIVPASEDSTRLPQNVQVTSALVHSCGMSFSLQPEDLTIQTQEQSTIERLPEENVSIVETLEGREDRPETVRAIANGTGRRKLYFNPAYFEPELLAAPPPAAIEFLTKIREVIAIAKHKMLAKRFAPTLLGIPEEDQLQQESIVGSQYGGRSSKHGTFGSISLKRENSRRRGCPGCTLELDGFIPIEEQSSACQSCCTPIAAVENKQHSIRKWLEDVPVGKANNFKASDTLSQTDDTNVLMRKSTDLKPFNIRSSHKGKAPSIPKQEEIPKRNKAVDSAILVVQKELNSKNISGKMIPAPPPPPFKTINALKGSSASPKETEVKKIKPTAIKNVSGPTPPPLPSLSKDEISEKSAINTTTKNKKETGEPVVAKQLMDAVIQELVGQRGLDTVKISEKLVKTPVKELDSSAEDNRKSLEEYEADSLERSARETDEKGMSTPTDYGDVPSQPSPTLSSALPLEEVLTMRNEIFNIKTGNKTISKLKLDTNKSGFEQPVSDDHEYEIIVLNPEITPTSSKKDITLYTLPELLNHNDGYSLVSEVYVNDGYNFGSVSSSPSNTSSSSGPKIRYSEPVEKPGHLTIQVEDSPENYVQYPDDSDSFEPDTLDRKPNKHKHEEPIPLVTNTRKQVENFNDSLERPAQILLRTTGSFRSDSLSQTGSDDLSQILNASPLNRGFGSLREIYEARTQYRNELDNISLVGSTRSLNNDMDTFSRRRGHHYYSRDSPRSIDGVILNPEAKQAKRQRPPTPPGSINGLHKPEPPDVIPPLPPKANAIYEDPPPPRPIYKVEPTPPLPPRSIKPPLPPKNGPGRSTSQKRMVTDPARRPLPPLPSPTRQKSNSFAQDISTMSSISTTESRDLETLSNLSGASVDSLNDSDYEAFYMAPYSGDEEQDGSRTLGHRVERSLTNKFSHFQQNKSGGDLNSQFILQSSRAKNTQAYENGSLPKSTKSIENEKKSIESPTSLEKRQSLDKDLVKHLRDKKGAESVKKTWRRMIENSVSQVPQKPEDSGYLSTDSNDSRRRRKLTKVTNSEGEAQSSSQGQGSVSETDESLCDGASESGGESIATDSFFFGSFRKLSTCAVVTESVDSGVGSDLVRTMNNSVLLEDTGGTSSDSENVSFVTVLPPGSGRRRSSIRC